MCIVHHPDLHYLFQNILAAFDQSKLVASTLVRRVGAYLCTCKADFLFSSHSIISIQHKMFDWFERESTSALAHFKPIIDELKQHTQIDSGTKIAFLNLLKDLDSGNPYKLEHIDETCQRREKNMFYSKLVILKFDLKLCSAREFIKILTTIDQGAFNFIQITNLSQITIRDEKKFSVRNLMGEIEATIESEHDRNLHGAEFYLRRLADVVNSRLAKVTPDQLCSMINLKMLLQPAPNSSLSDILAAKSSIFDQKSSHPSGLFKNMDLKSQRPSDLKLMKAKCKNDSLLDEDSILELSSAGSRSNVSTPMTSSPKSSASMGEKLDLKTEKKKSRKKRSSHRNKNTTASSDSENSREKKTKKTAEYVDSAIITAVSGNKCVLGFSN